MTVYTFRLVSECVLKKPLHDLSFCNRHLATLILATEKCARLLEGIFGREKATFNFQITFCSQGLAEVKTYLKHWIQHKVSSVCKIPRGAF